MRYSVIAAIALLSLGTVPQVLANGAAWNPGTTAGLPGPVQQSDLVLEEEFVDIGRGKNHVERIVSATFRVKNPTNREISTVMGFPVDYKEYVERGGEGFLAHFAKSVSVMVDGRAIPLSVSKDKGNAYSAVIMWSMSFAARKYTEFKVEYPVRVSDKGADNPDYATGGGGSDSTITFRYITHTGAYWAGDIGKAVFRYCDTNIDDRIYREPHVSKKEWNAEGTSLETAYWDLDVKPQPYTIDAENKCILWERTKWKPRKPQDDIELRLRKGEYTYTYGGEKEEGPREFKYQDTFNAWCGNSDHGKRAPQFAELMALDVNKIEDLYADLERKAYYHPDKPPVDAAKHSGDDSYDPDVFARLPSHLKSDFQMKFLRYLRNYFYAVHSHVFKSADLAECFQGVLQRKTWQPLEKRNVEWIKEKEQEVVEFNRSAWEGLRPIK